MEKENIAGIVVMSLGLIYFSFYHFYLYPKITKLKWVRNFFNLSGERPPFLDGMKFSGWGFVWALGLFLWICPIILAVVLIF